ncbi:MAG TPA: phosphotriesterase [Vicinamibacteria bacterium]|nr:phosphotriesterase [Vicinamibacteria bacterium]
MSRRAFLAALVPLAVRRPPRAGAATTAVWTATGAVAPEDLGTTLTHEHVLVDFVGADKVGRHRYDAEDAFRAALPHLRALRARGCRTLVECTPAYIGRDPALLRRLSEKSGLHILTNTGYYGAANDKFVPPHAYAETAEQLAARWTAEWTGGIEGTGIRPAFLKIGVDGGPLSPIDRKLVAAGALCHRRTGLRLHVHTGDGVAAQAIVDLLKAERVAPDAYVWVHAQNEKDRAVHRRLASEGVWISLDGVSEASLDAHVGGVADLARAGHLGRVLVSQDAGWYRVGEPGGGRFRPYTFLFDAFLPALHKTGLSEADTRALLVDNPARVLTPMAATA